MLLAIIFILITIGVILANKQVIKDHFLSLAGVTVSLRVMRDGSKLIRLSPHFYNTPAELYRLLEAL